MRSPLGQFAERIVRCDEVEELLEGIVREYRFPIERLETIVKKISKEQLQVQRDIMYAWDRRQP